jgi:hypothetical protein
MLASLVLSGSVGCNRAEIEKQAAVIKPKPRSERRREKHFIKISL